MIQRGHVTPTATSYHPLTKAERFCRKFGNFFPPLFDSACRRFRQKTYMYFHKMTPIRDHLSWKAIRTFSLRLSFQHILTEPNNKDNVFTLYIASGHLLNPCIWSVTFLFLVYMYLQKCRGQTARWWFLVVSRQCWWPHHGFRAVRIWVSDPT